MLIQPSELQISSEMVCFTMILWKKKENKINESVGNFKAIFIELLRVEIQVDLEPVHTNSDTLKPH